MTSAVRAPQGRSAVSVQALQETFSIGSRKRRQDQTRETGEILRLLLEKVPLRRIMEIADVPSHRLCNRIDVPARQCREFLHKDQAFAGRNRVLSTGGQTILANGRHANRVPDVPIRHPVTVDRDTGSVVAATTDFCPETDAIARAMVFVDAFDLPCAWHLHGRVDALSNTPFAPPETTGEHRSGRPRRIDTDPELRAFLLARIDHMSYPQPAQAVAETFPPHCRVGKSAIQDRWSNRPGRERPVRISGPSRNRAGSPPSSGGKPVKRGDKNK